MKTYEFITLREKRELKNTAAEWFNSKWGVPTEAYLECMDAYLNKETKNGWYLCLDGEKIVGGLGVIDNDFHDRKDLAPNVCAVYTEDEYRCKGIAGQLLDLAVSDMKDKGKRNFQNITNFNIVRCPLNITVNRYPTRIASFISNSSSFYNS